MKRRALALYYLNNIEVPEDQKSKEQLASVIEDQKEFFRAAYLIVKNEKMIDATSDSIEKRATPKN